jgi:hypothetical protein
MIIQNSLLYKGSQLLKDYIEGCTHGTICKRHSKGILSKFEFYDTKGKLIGTVSEYKITSNGLEGIIIPPIKDIKIECSIKI